MIFRKRFVLAAAFSLLGVLVLSNFSSATHNNHDAVTNRVLSRLNQFTDWLEDPNAGPVAKGYIGEVGWPNNERHVMNDQGEDIVPADDEDKWNALGAKFYQEANEHNLWVTAQAIDERLDNVFYSIYAGPGSRAVSEPGPGPQHQVLENNLGVEDGNDYRRGVNVAGGQSIDRDEFWTGNLGTFDERGSNSYWYAGVADDGPNGESSWDYLKSRGLDVVRLGFRWERMQNSPSGPINEQEWQRYLAALEEADSAGIKVIVDLHNYSKYYGAGPGEYWVLGSPQLTKADFVDFWEKFSAKIRNNPVADRVVVGYDIMNEPSNGEGVDHTYLSQIPDGRDPDAYAWEDMSTAVYNAIREHEADRNVIVPVTGDAGVDHPEKWLPADDNLIYTEHFYFDTAGLPGGGGGNYEYSYADDNEYWANNGFEDNSGQSTVPADNTYVATHDAWVTEASPDAVRGNADNLLSCDNCLNGTQDLESYVQFNSADFDAGDELELRFESIENTDTKPALHYLPNATIDEGELTWNNKPGPGTQLAAAQPQEISPGDTITYDVSEAADDADGVLTFRIVQSSSDRSAFAAKENSTGAQKPTLAVTRVAPGSTNIATHDAWVTEASPDATRGAADNLLACDNCLNGTQDLESYVRFDNVPTEGVTSATLRFEARESWMSGPTVYTLPNATFDEGNITFNNKPGPGTAIGKGSPDVATPGTIVEFDVTEAIQADNDGTTVFRLLAAMERIGFESKDGTSGAMKPTLVINGGVNDGELTPENQAVASEDVFARENGSGDDWGNLSYLLACNGCAGGNSLETYLQFDSADFAPGDELELQLEVFEEASQKPALYYLPEADIDENELNWDNRPQPGTELEAASAQEIVVGSKVTYDVSEVADDADGVLTFRLVQPNDDRIAFAAKENTGGNMAPTLIVNGGDTPPPPQDSDNDGVADENDNCPNVANPGQTDDDGDGIGNACDDTPNGDPTPGSQTVASHDAWVNENSPTAVRGNTDRLLACDNCQPGNQDLESYVQFNGANFKPGDTIQFRMEAVEDTDTKPALYYLSDATFDESTLNWNNKPGPGTQIKPAQTNAINAGDTITYDVSNEVAGDADGIVTFRLVNASSDRVGFASKENTTNASKPTLIVNNGGDTPPPPQDSDNDGVADENDNCPNVANPGQTDDDGDGIGNACDSSQPPQGPQDPNPGKVIPVVETEPVPHDGDAADDPAIWVNKANPSQSRVIGTDKHPQGGLRVYNLDGEEVQKVNLPEANNVDLRDGYTLGGQEVALVVASNQVNEQVPIYQVNNSGILSKVGQFTSTTDNNYGICMYHNRITDKFYVFVNSEAEPGEEPGEVEQWELFNSGGSVDARKVRSFDVGSQTEGCVADEERQLLYIGEENVGIWRYGANPNDGNSRTSVDRVNSSTGLKADVEGLTISYGPNGGYLYASSQGNDSFTVYERGGDNDFVQRFRIQAGNGIDGVGGTDGIEAVSTSLGPQFPYGMFVAQDGSRPQTFKFVQLHDIVQ